MSRMTKARLRAEWLGQFNATLVSRFPKVAGRIDWDTANHMYNIGLSPDVAVDRYAETYNLILEALREGPSEVQE